MKKIIEIGLILLLGTLTAGAQNFSKRIATSIDDNLTSLQAEWVSMDNDTTLDIMIAGVVGGELKIFGYDNNLVNHSAIATGMKSGTIQLADWDRDNRIDILVAGKTSDNTDGIFCFINNGDFTLTKVPGRIIDHSAEFRVGDINGDGAPDIISFSNTFIRVHDHNGELKFEQAGINITDASVFDMNKDGVNDITVSGPDLTSVFINKRDFVFERINAATPLDGALSVADFNNDGLFDVIVAGTDKSKLWINHGGDTLIVDQEFEGLDKPELFTGDITSDGNVDIFTDTTVDSNDHILQRTGDWDRDGDLDVVQAIDSVGKQWLKVYENITPAINGRPVAPAIGYAISTFDRTFIFWEPATDDHTTTASLTYDVWLGSDQGNVLSPSFDPASSWRSAVHHGNAGTNTSMIIDSLVDNRYFYYVQTVDNAYNGSPMLGGGVLPCFDLTHNNVQACKGQEVSLAGGTGAVWFSVSQGFLGSSESLTFVATATDTLFAFIPPATDCSKNKVFVVHVNDSPVPQQETIYACKDRELRLTIPDGWDKIVWSSPPVFVVTQPDTITVTAGNDVCSFRKEFFIRVSEPVVEITGDGFQVMRGNSVQLEATGNAEQWSWQPGESLDNPFVPNPVATPLATTEYIVTGTDSVGCKATDSIQVLVEETAFVPNLFTPNGDGKNDSLMIYGLTTSAKFNFRIFNREGSMVFETKDISQATSVGWNGTVGGTRQPSGIYYWRVDGETPTGNKLLLNGKTTGSILLVY